LREITTFPSSKYDDQADSTSQALARINRQPPKPGFIEFELCALARAMRNRGLSAKAIAMQVDSAPEEIEQWLNDFKEAEARTQARLESQFAARCNKCGEAQVGSDAYHPACWQG
jgi:hypothetical protein